MLYAMQGIFAFPYSKLIYGKTRENKRKKQKSKEKKEGEKEKKIKDGGLCFGHYGLLLI